MSVLGSHAGVGDLVQDRLAHLGLVVQEHEVTAESESTSCMIRLAGPAARTVEAQLPVSDAGLLHESACQDQDVGKVHGSTVCAGGLVGLVAAPVVPAASRRRVPSR